MSMKHVTVFSCLLLMAFFSLPAKAQSQSDINNLRALMPWAEKLDQQRTEQRQREARRGQQQLATMEQNLRDREEFTAAVLATRTARAKAVKNWNQKQYPAPPLFPGESLVYTLNGCGLVLPMLAEETHQF